MVISSLYCKAGKVFQVYGQPSLGSLPGMIQLAKAVSIRLTQTSQYQHTRDAKTWVMIIVQRVGTSLLRLWMGRGCGVGWDEAQTQLSPIL